MSPVTVGLDGAGRAIISSNETTYKVRHLRRDPRAALCVFVEAFRGPWVQIEGTAEIVTLPDAMEPLVDYYRRLAGEHPDWEDYRRAMTADRRALIRITLERAVPEAPWASACGIACAVPDPLCGLSSAPRACPGEPSL